MEGGVCQAGDMILSEGVWLPSLKRTWDFGSQTATGATQEDFLGLSSREMGAEGGDPSGERTLLWQGVQGGHLPYGESSMLS